jgi:hypothetical protein
MKRIRKNMSNSSVTEMEDPVATRNAWIWTWQALRLATDALGYVT